MDAKEDVGYLLARVENVEKEMSSIKSDIRSHMKDEEIHRKQDALERAQARKELNAKLDAIIAEQNIYRAVWLVIKTMALAVLAAVVFWFDHIISFFKG